MVDRCVERLERLYRTRKRKSADEICSLATMLLDLERSLGIIVETDLDLHDILKEERRWRSK